MVGVWGDRTMRPRGLSTYMGNWIRIEPCYRRTEWGMQMKLAVLDDSRCPDGVCGEPIGVVVSMKCMRDLDWNFVGDS